MEQVAKEQNEANVKQLEQKEYPKDIAAELRKPFTAQDVKTKLVHRFSNTGPSKSQQAKGVCLGCTREWMLCASTGEQRLALTVVSAPLSC
jgi:hypothetical protein